MHDPYVVAFEIKRPWPDGRIGFHRHWPAMVTVWHVEPGGHNSGTVCRRTGAWKWHVHHYRVQVRPLQHLRRWALIRCAWCGGRQRKDDPINISSSWNGVRTRWWRGEAELRHHDCSLVWLAHRKCLCDDPLLDGDGFGRCAFCGNHRAWGQEVTEADRLLAALPERGRIPAGLQSRLDAIWAGIRAERKAAEDA